MVKCLVFLGGNLEEIASGDAGDGGDADQDLVQESALTHLPAIGPKHGDQDGAEGGAGKPRDEDAADDRRHEGCDVAPGCCAHEPDEVLGELVTLTDTEVL